MQTAGDKVVLENEILGAYAGWKEETLGSIVAPGSQDVWAL